MFSEFDNFLAPFNKTETLHPLNAYIAYTAYSGFQLGGGRESRPEGLSYEARSAESGSGVLGEGGNQPLPTS